MKNISIFNVKFDNNDKIIYNDLLPSNNSDKDSGYSDMLSNMLKKEDVTNIAITGTYGSGKSSFIKTFKKNNKKKYKYLNISLASFSTTNNTKINNEINTEIDNEVPDVNTNEIEENILQQIFYTVKPSKIKFSRYKRIFELSSVKLICNIFLIFILALVIMILLNFQFVESLYNTILNIGLLKQIGIVIAILISIYFIFISIKNILTYFCISKIKVKTTVGDIDVENKQNKNESIFNKNLEEILYFFEKTNYDIVIFEDIDRFYNVDIFIKLREINKIINSYKKKKIVFIYAVRDDLFNKEKDRTKFFDAIIPIIPVINSTNSNDMLNDMLITMNVKAELSKEFVNNISIYIDDMRLLKNIANEFVIYSKKLKKIELKDEKMFSIITYKNLYPNEFSNLQFNKGQLVEIINGKNDIIKNKVIEIDEEINELRKYLKYTNTEILQNFDEIKIILYKFLIEKLEIDEANNEKLSVNGSKYNLKTFISNIDIEKLYDLKYAKFNNWNNNINIDVLENLEKNLKENQKIKNRIGYIKLKDEENKNNIKIDIEKLQEDKNKIKSMSLSKILSEYGTDFISEDIRSNKLLMFLLKRGYIDENYQEYVSHFYEGTLTINDKIFVKSIKDEEKLSYDYRLKNIDMIIDRLEYFEFRKKYILNYDLLSYLLENELLYKDNINNIFNFLRDNTRECLEFIDGYIIISIENNKKIFINKLSKYCKDIWKQIEKSEYKSEKKDIYVYNIIKYSDVEDLKYICEVSNFKDYISNTVGLFGYFNEKEQIDVIEKIYELQIKLNKIDLYQINSIVVDKILDNDLYNINSYMINELLNFKLSYKKRYLNIFETIYELNDTRIIKYIELNINIYIKNCFIIDDKILKKEESLIKILNFEELDLELLNKVLEKNKIIISNIKTINIDKWGIIFQQRFIHCCWKNIVEYHSEQGFDEILIDYINNEDVYNSLGNQIIDDKVVKANERYNDFIVDLFVSDIKDEAFESATNKMSYEYSNLEFEHITEVRAKYIISNKFVNLDTVIFNNLKKTYDSLIPDLINIDINKFIKEQDDYEIDSKDLYNIFKSNYFIDEDKAQILIQANNILCDSADFADRICNVIVPLKHRFEMELELFISIIRLGSILKNKILLLIQQFEFLQVNIINDSFGKLGYPYSEIPLSNKNPLLVDNNINRMLVEKLVNLDYISKIKYESKGIRIYKVKKIV